MRFAELVWRIGAAAIACLVGYAQCLLLAVVPQIECSRRDNDPYFASLAIGVLLLALLPLSSLGLPLRRRLRGLTLPFVLLVPLALRGVWPFFDAGAVADMYRCSASAGWAAAEAPAAWHAAWAPLQAVLLALLAAQCLRFWRR